MINDNDLNGMNIVLCDVRAETLWRTVTACFEDDKLTVEGQDLGIAPERFFGSDEYEYWYYFDKENTAKLMRELTKTGINPIAEMKRLFSGMNACCELKAFCDENGVEYRFDSWV